jgi:hypothetical protein
MKYRGSCHCGRIAFDVEGTIEEVMACNCSICARRGSLLWFTGRDQLTLRTPVENISVYKFNKHVIAHNFCAQCGIHTFGEGRDPKGNATAAVNVRCLEDFDFGSLPVKHWDGRAM